MSHATDKNPARRPILSHTTILILSAFLIGLIVNDLFPDSIKAYAIATAGVGLLAYLALDLVATRRRDRAMQRQQAEFDAMIESRVRRHQPSEPRAGH